MTLSATPSPSASLGALAPFPFGAVYFRKSNPPKEDWERDYQTAAEDGMNTFRQWVMWAAIEISPGEYDWEDYDRQLELAARHGAKVINAEMITAAPEWAWRQYDHARYEARDGSRARSQMSGSCATGGFPGLCLDNEDLRTRAGEFLTALASHYRGHAGLGGYDVWNECNISSAYCYCAATQAKFREWLREKYGDTRRLGQAWQRHSITDWEDIQAPRGLGPWPDVMDWLQFRINQAYQWMRWRVNTIRAADPEATIVAHGIASSLNNMAAGACDEWRSAAEVEGWGYTWGSSRHGDEPWKQWHAVDLVRAGATSPAFNGDRPKPYWHAEAYAGPLWLQSNVLGKPRDEGRTASPADVRLWAMQSFAAGATGLLYLRWRPLLDGPLFGAFGAYAMDGSRTPRSEIASTIGKWTVDEAQRPLWEARPVRGDVGIIVAPDSQLLCYAQHGNTDFYAQCARGAYRGFFENNVQPDWVHIQDIRHYRLLYLPFPIHLTSDTARRLTEWVNAGGTLVSEGCPGHWSSTAEKSVTVSPVQPALGLDALFGARQAEAEFMPDILGGLTFEWNGVEAQGGIYMQTYDLTGGVRTGHYTGDVAGPLKGRTAAVEHTSGAGKTLLIGTFPGYGHFHAREDEADNTRRVFSSIMEWAGVKQHVRVLSKAAEHADRWWGVTARIHASPEGSAYLWVTNPGHDGVNVQLEIAKQWAPAGAVHALWGEDPPRVTGRQLSVVVPARDAAVIRLR